MIAGERFIHTLMESMQMTQFPRKRILKYLTKLYMLIPNDSTIHFLEILLKIMLGGKKAFRYRVFIVALITKVKYRANTKCSCRRN